MTPYEPHEITTFKSADQDTKLNMLFDAIGRLSTDVQAITLISCPAQKKACDTRFKKIEGMKKWNALASAGGGVLGGFLAMITKFYFWK